MHKYYRGDSAELRKMLELCDIEINCILCANCNVDEIKNLPNADLNVVLHKDYGYESAELLNELYGMPYYCLGELPIGFSSVTIKFFDGASKRHKVCGARYL